MIHFFLFNLNKEWSQLLGHRKPITFLSGRKCITVSESIQNWINHHKTNQSINFQCIGYFEVAVSTSLNRGNVRWLNFFWIPHCYLMFTLCRQRVCCLSLNASHSHRALFSDNLCRVVYPVHWDHVLKMPEPQAIKCILLITGEGAAFALEFASWMKSRRDLLTNLNPCIR